MQIVLAMNKALPISAVILALIVFTGCIIPGTRRERAEIELQRNDSIFVVDDGDFRFRISLPKDLMITHTPEITLHEHENRIEISCGPSFHITGEISDTHAKQLPDQVGAFHYNEIDNEDNSCLFARNLPNGEVFDYGVLQHIDFNHTYYTFYSDDQGEYTLQDVLKMRTALASIKM
jgi:hypothetical protein